MNEPILGGFAEWLAARTAGHRGSADMTVLQADICGGLVDLGLPLWRSALLLETLHPVESGRQVLWVDGVVSTTSRERETAFFDDYARSPLLIVDQTGRPLRRRLDQPEQEMSVLASIQQQGGTDYFLAPLPFIDDVRSAAISFTTRAPDGFSAADIARMELAAAIVGPFVERIMTREIAINLLDTYIGRRSGEKVFAGQIDRTGVERIDAAVLFADLRNFTGTTNRINAEQVVILLDDWFDVVGGAVDPRGGEILKFMGDGVLAVFPTNGDRQAVCEAAIAAARAIIEAGHALTVEIDGKREPVSFGIGMHVGEVAYGNVGTRTRLDFTVVGRAVNLASRLQSLTATLGIRAVASAEFADAVAEQLPLLGDMTVRGFPEAITVHQVCPPDSD